MNVTAEENKKLEYLHVYAAEFKQWLRCNIVDVDCETFYPTRFFAVEIIEGEHTGDILKVLPEGYLKYI